MALRAEQWAMVGVVGIGAFAAYLLTRARPRDLERVDFAPQRPPQQQTNASLFAAAPLGPYTGALVVGPPGEPSHALLRRGDSVLGRLELGGSDRAGDDATALRNLQLAGFSNVRLFTAADIAINPGLVPLADALANVGTGSRWFYGTWNGNGTTLAGDVVMPREVVLLSYVTTTPPPRMAFASP